jgi:UDPglucose 6-dehydrogenase
MDQAKLVLSNVTYCDGPYDCAEGADAVVIVTEWEQFRALDFERLKKAMAKPVLVDLRNVYRADFMQDNGFSYVGVGRIASRAPRHDWSQAEPEDQRFPPASAERDRILS